MLEGNARPERRTFLSARLGGNGSLFSGQSAINCTARFELVEIIRQGASGFRLHIETMLCIVAFVSDAS